MRCNVITASAAMLLLLCSTASAQWGNRDPYGRGRDGYRDPGGYRDRGGYGVSGLVQSIQEHLRRASSYERPRGREYDRYRNAMRRLSEFESKMNRGRYDKDCLDQAIEDVNNIVRHNRLDRRDRSTLATDVERLRDFRARYRY